MAPSKKSFAFVLTFLRITLVISVLCCLSLKPREAENEAKIKARFIYSFVKYIHWPADKSFDIFTIGVVGKTATLDELKKMCQNKIVDEKSIRIIQVNETEAIDDCQVIFITRSQSFLLGDVLDVVDKRGTLIITEAKGMLQKGSAINLIRDGQKETF